MVDVGVVRVRVHDRVVNVRMGMRFASIPLEIVSMLVMGIVKMSVSVFLMAVGVQVGVMLANMQPYPHGHEHACGAKLPCNGLVV